MVQTGRVEYKPIYSYGPKTYLGNWVEDRHRYQKQNYHHTTTYTNDFVPKGVLDPDLETIWDRKVQGTGNGDLLFPVDIHNCGKNFTTTYDLSYNHLPKLKPVERNWRILLSRWDPIQDLTHCFGNLTDYGIVNYKKQLWEDQKADPRVTSTTEYQDSYPPPDKKDYTLMHYVIPSENVTLLQPINIDTETLMLRNTHTFYVPPNEDLIPIARESPCNPITWECKPRAKFHQKLQALKKLDKN